MNELIQTFNFGVNEVRTAIKDNGDVYFCLTDVLEISNANPRLVFSVSSNCYLIVI